MFEFKFGFDLLSMVIEVSSKKSSTNSAIYICSKCYGTEIKYNYGARKISCSYCNNDVKNFKAHFLTWIKLQAKRWSYLSLRSFIGCQDSIKAIIRAHAALNNRKQLCLDDLYFVSLVRPYLVNPFNPFEGKIVELKAQGLTNTEICQKLGKSRGYSTQVRRIVEKARLRGILPLENE